MLTGKKILIVDDNEANQLLAKTILEKRNATISIASNGLEATEVFRRGLFDLILMDLQMPVMDGFEATKIIRLKDNKVPIIAFTANVLAGENRIEKHQMNGFIGKPFKEKYFLNTIYNTLELTDEIDISKENITKDPTDQLFNLDEIIDISNGNTDFVDTMLEIFISALATTATEFQNAIATDDMDLIKNSAHKIKPSIESFGVPFSKKIRSIEELAVKNNNGPELKQLVETFDNLVQNLIPRLKSRHSQLS